MDTLPFDGLYSCICSNATYYGVYCELQILETIQLSISPHVVTQLKTERSYNVQVNGTVTLMDISGAELTVDAKYVHNRP